MAQHTSCGSFFHIRLVQDLARIPADSHPSGCPRSHGPWLFSCPASCALCRSGESIGGWFLGPRRLSPQSLMDGSYWQYFDFCWYNKITWPNPTPPRCLQPSHSEFQVSMPGHFSRPSCEMEFILHAFSPILGWSLLFNCSCFLFVCFIFFQSATLCQKSRLSFTVACVCDSKHGASRSPSLVIPASDFLWNQHHPGLWRARGSPRWGHYLGQLTVSLGCVWWRSLF